MAGASRRGPNPPVGARPPRGDGETCTQRSAAVDCAPGSRVSERACAREIACICRSEWFFSEESGSPGCVPWDCCLNRLASDPPDPASGQQQITLAFSFFKKKFTFFIKRVFGYKHGKEPTHFSPHPVHSGLRLWL